MPIVFLKYLSSILFMILPRLLCNFWFSKWSRNVWAISSKKLFLLHFWKSIRDYFGFLVIKSKIAKRLFIKDVINHGGGGL